MQYNIYIVEVLIFITSTTRLRALLDVFSLAFGLQGLSWDLLHHIIALLPRSWSTFSCTDIGALLVVHILGHCGGHIVTNLFRNFIAHLTGFIDIIAHLLGDWLTNVSLVGGALTVRDFLGVDL